MPARRATIALAAAAALALALAGCGGATEIDYQKASETVRASLESRRQGFGVKVETVECPRGVKVEPGTRFECVVRYPDGKVAYARLEVRTADGDLNLESLGRRPVGG